MCLAAAPKGRRPGVPSPQQLRTKLRAALPVKTCFCLSAETVRAARQPFSGCYPSPVQLDVLVVNCCSLAIALTRLRSSKVQLCVARQQLSSLGLNDQAAEGRGRPGQGAQRGSLRGRWGQIGGTLSSAIEGVAARLSSAIENSETVLRRPRCPTA